MMVVVMEIMITGDDSGNTLDIVDVDMIHNDKYSG